LDTLETEKADALLVAGDVFDSANPSAASHRLLYRFVREAKRRLRNLGIVLIAGNHDSPGRLEAPSPLLEVLGVTVVGQLCHPEASTFDAERMLVPLLDREGGIAAWCLAVPFLRPGDVPRVETEGDAYLAGVELVLSQGLDLALSRRERGQAMVALAHCHLAGGQTSQDSERRLFVGGAEALPPHVFGSDLAYVALGHLHRPQAIAGQARPGCATQEARCRCPSPRSTTLIR
jgi:exonuclease SbcD